MKGLLQGIFGSDPVSTVIGVGIGGLQAYGSHSIKQWAIALGIALLGRVTNEVQSKYGSSSPQSGFARVPVLGVLVTMLLACPLFAGVSKIAAKHLIAPAAQHSYSGAKAGAHAVKKSGKFAWKVLF